MLSMNIKINKLRKFKFRTPEEFHSSIKEHENAVVSLYDQFYGGMCYSEDYKEPNSEGTSQFITKSLYDTFYQYGQWTS